jgi:regulator of vacuolar morphogenesis
MCPHLAMPLDITIPTTSTSDGPKPFTLYTIRISAPLRTTTVQKRYSDFAALHSLLTTQAGAAPPVPLPGKSWLGGGLGKLGLGSTAGSPELVETRRRGLEAYLRGIEGADDARWRGTDAWRAFLDLGSGVPARNGAAAGALGLARDAITSAGAWLDAHAELKSRLQEARLWLTRREQAGSAARQHEAGANAKRGLVRAGTLIQALEEGLERLSGKRGADEWSGDRLGDGEVRRRRDLIGAARKEREGLEGVLNTMAVKSAASSAPGHMGVGAATQGEKEGLFRGAAASGAGAGRRVLGAPAKETERTRELDNDGVLQLQKQIMAEQDDDLMDLAKVARRMREMGVQINEEIVLQNQMLGLLDDDVDRYVQRFFRVFLVGLGFETLLTNDVGLRAR